MSITVVTTRDDAGAPSSREVYAVGARYAIGNSNLEIFSAESRLLALYPSGSWTSVHVDDNVRVVPAGSEDASDVGSAFDEALGPDVAVDADADAEIGADSVGLDLADESVVGADPHRAEPDAEPPVEHDVTPEPEPVATLTRPQPARPQPVEDDAVRTATEGETGRSPLLRPVVFAPKTYQAARGADAGPTPGSTPESAGSGMRLVAFRPRIYRAARGAHAAPKPGSTSEPVETRMQRVVFRPKTYRAARTGGPDESAPQDGAESVSPRPDGDPPG